jgi:hypothetical protein
VPGYFLSELVAAGAEVVAGAAGAEAAGALSLFVELPESLEELPELFDSLELEPLDGFELP